MRQSEEGAVEIRKTLKIVRRFDERQIGQAEKITVDFADRFTGVLVRGDKFDFNVRMQQ